MAAPQNARKSKVSLHGNAVAGLAAGLCSAVAMHPLDVLTTRLQAQSHRSEQGKNVARALLDIARTDGIRHLYVGVVPNIVGSMMEWGVYFLGYNYVRNQLRNYINRGTESSPQAEIKELTASMNLLCATLIGCVSTVITQPIWLAKTRLQLQTGENRQKSMTRCIISVVKSEGLG